MKLRLRLLYALMLFTAGSHPGFAQDIPKQPLDPQLVSSQVTKIHQEEEAVSNCFHLLNNPTYSTFVCIATHEKNLEAAYATIYPPIKDIQDEIVNTTETLSRLWVDRSFLTASTDEAHMQKEIFLKTDLPEQISLEEKIEELLRRKQALLQKMPLEFRTQADLQVNHWNAFLYNEKSIMTKFAKE